MRVTITIEDDETRTLRIEESQRVAALSEEEEEADAGGLDGGAARAGLGTAEPLGGGAIEPSPTPTAVFDAGPAPTLDVDGAEDAPVSGPSLPADAGAYAGGADGGST